MKPERATELTYLVILVVIALALVACWLAGVTRYPSPLA